jgi:hypothetical protein
LPAADLNELAVCGLVAEDRRDVRATTGEPHQVYWKTEDSSPERRAMDQKTRRYWLNVYRQWARMTQAQLDYLSASEGIRSDPVANQVKRRLHTLIEIYDAAIQELEKEGESS